MLNLLGVTHERLIDFDALFIDKLDTLFKTANDLNRAEQRKDLNAAVLLNNYGAFCNRCEKYKNALGYLNESLNILNTLNSMSVNFK